MVTERLRKTKNNDGDWLLVIKPKRPWFDVDIKELWHYRDLYAMYIRRDFIAYYKQTILGPLWLLIQPLFTTIVYMFIFGGLAGISTDGIPQPLFYMSGIMLWTYFSNSFMQCASVFTGNAAIFGKVYFPRLIVPLASVTSNLLKMAVQFAMFLAMYLWYYVNGAPAGINWTVCLLPLLVVVTAFHAISWGLIVSSVTSKYRDLNMLVGFGLSLFMYVTPVVYPLSAMPGRYRWLIEMNPLTPVFEMFRYGLLGGGAPDWGGLLYSVVFMSVMLFASVVVFNRVERNFIDTV